MLNVLKGVCSGVKEQTASLEGMHYKGPKEQRVNAAVSFGPATKLSAGSTNRNRKLALAHSIASTFLALDEPKKDHLADLGDPTGQCRRIMNTWLAKCLFS